MFAALSQRHTWLKNPVSWFMNLQEEDRAGYLAGIDLGLPEEISRITEFLKTVQPSNGHKPKAGGGMRLVDAYCRARAILHSQYEHVDGYSDDLTDAQFSKLVAETPCPYPDDDGYPLPSGWEDDYPFLKKPFSWFYGLKFEEQTAYMEQLVGKATTEAVDLVNTMFNHVEDTGTGTTTSSSGRDGPIRVHRDPGKALLAYLAGKEAPVPARFVADVLLMHCNAKTGHTWPSVSTIEGYTGLGRRTVQYAIKWLIDEKVIREVKPFQHGGNRYASRVFEFTSKVPL